MTKSMVQKILHDPIMFVKDAGHHGKKDFYLGLIRRIFRLDMEPVRRDDPVIAGKNDPDLTSAGIFKKRLDREKGGHN